MSTIGNRQMNEIRPYQESYVCTCEKRLLEVCIYVQMFWMFSTLVDVELKFGKQNYDNTELGSTKSLPRTKHNLEMSSPRTFLPAFGCIHLKEGLR